MAAVPFDDLPDQVTPRRRPVPQDDLPQIGEMEMPRLDVSHHSHDNAKLLVSVLQKLALLVA
jgi:hypothetical protein